MSEKHVAHAYKAFAWGPSDKTYFYSTKRYCLVRVVDKTSTIEVTSWKRGI